MKPGLSLLEVVFSMMIATIMITASFTIYNQISKTTQVLQTITNNDTKVTILQNRLQQDLTGICPLWFTKEQYEHLKAGQASDNEQKPTFDDSTKNNFFFADNNDDGSFQFCTFMTVNPIHMYGTENQRFLRVVYKLEQNKQDKKQFRLLRKEIRNSSNNNMDSKLLLSEHSFYEILTQVSDFSIEYGFINQPKHQSKNKKPDQQSDQQPIKIQWLQEWGKVSEKTKSNEYKPALPEFIKIKITFSSAQKQKQEYEIYCTIPVDSTSKLTSIVQNKHKHQTKNSAKKDDKKAEGHPQKPQPSTPKQHEGVKHAA